MLGLRKPQLLLGEARRCVISPEGPGHRLPCSPWPLSVVLNVSVRLPLRRVLLGLSAGQLLVAKESEPDTLSPLPVRLTFVANKPTLQAAQKSTVSTLPETLAPSFLGPGHGGRDLRPACGCLPRHPAGQARTRLLICGFGFGGHAAQRPRLVVGGQLFQPGHRSPSHPWPERPGWVRTDITVVPGCPVRGLLN